MYFLTLFHRPLTIRKWHCRDTPYSELKDIDILRICRKQGNCEKKFLSNRGKKASNPISIVSNDVLIFQYA